PEGAQILAMSPHMHVRGKSFKYELQQLPGRTSAANRLSREDEAKSKRTVVLDIPEYDFNWQTAYWLKEPIVTGSLDRFYCTASFDNSEKNLNNPDPTARVRWGDQTWDEMMIGYFHYAVPIQQPVDNASTEKSSAGRNVGSRIRNAAVMAIFIRLDRDGDGRLDKKDCPEKYAASFLRLDANGDDVLTREEIRQAQGSPLGFCAVRSRTRPRRRVW
ncbi:MAG: hypothetical protein AAFP90_15660, partial [Planctomycetota bacterium]